MRSRCEYRLYYHLTYRDFYVVSITHDRSLPQIVIRNVVERASWKIQRVPPVRSQIISGVAITNTIVRTFSADAAAADVPLVRWFGASSQPSLPLLEPSVQRWRAGQCEALPVRNRLTTFSCYRSDRPVKEELGRLSAFNP